MNQRSSDRLARLFSSLLIPIAAGCAAEGPGDGGIDEEMFIENLCSGNVPTLLDIVEPEVAVDYVEDRLAQDTNFGAGEPNWEVVVRSSSGTRCGGSSDETACNEAFDALPLESDFAVGFELPAYASLAFTRGDEVGSVGTDQALREFLGTIDTVGDAALLATFGTSHYLACESPAQAVVTDGGYLLLTRTGGGCGEGDDIDAHVVRVGADGVVEVIESELITPGDPNCAVGRLPAGMCRRSRMGATDPVGGFFAEVAQLEAAAVHAFGQFANELQVHGAPSSMVRAARRAQADEVRHARVMARVARRYGGRPVMPRVVPPRPRPLLEVAAENAAEGCTRETFGALVAHAQARRAAAPTVRRAFAQIARDETRHATLSWRFDAWARARMNASERRTLERARSEAWERLERDLTVEHHPRVHAEAGMPHADEARAMYRGLRAAMQA